MNSRWRGTVVSLLILCNVFKAIHRCCAVELSVFTSCPKWTKWSRPWRYLNWNNKTFGVFSHNIQRDKHEILKRTWTQHLYHCTFLQHPHTTHGALSCNRNTAWGWQGSISDTMTIRNTLGDHGQRYRPRMACLKKVRLVFNMMLTSLFSLADAPTNGLLIFSTYCMSYTRFAATFTSLVLTQQVFKVYCQKAFKEPACFLFQSVLKDKQFSMIIVIKIIHSLYW